MKRDTKMYVQAFGIILMLVLLALLLSGCGSDIRVPSVPEGLQVYDEKVDSLSVIWDQSVDNVGVTGYEVYRNGQPYILTSYLGFVDSGLSNSTEYCYQVRAYDSVNNVSPFSSIECGSTLPVIVNAPIINSP